MKFLFWFYANSLLLAMTYKHIEIVTFIIENIKFDVNEKFIL